MDMRSNLVTFFLIILLLISGCTSTNNDLNEQEKKSLLTHTQATTRDLFLSINTKDYELFSNNFSQDMRESFTIADFDDLREQVLDQYGEYRSHSVKSFGKIDHYVSIQYHVVFEDNDDVRITIVYQPKEPYNISGLWIDAPQLK